MPGPAQAGFPAEVQRPDSVRQRFRRQLRAVRVTLRACAGIAEDKKKHRMQEVVKRVIKDIFISGSSDV